MLFEELGIGDQCTTKADYLMVLNRFLIERHEKGESTVLIVDEAQNLSPDLLEEIRLLSNLETSTAKLIQIILVGQPELAEALERPELRQLRQRISLRHHLEPFDRDDTERYIQERLERAGHVGKRLFARSASRAVFERTGGIPRLINTLCDASLLLGYSRDRTALDAAVVREAADGMGLDSAAGVAERANKKRRGGRRWFGLRV